MDIDRLVPPPERPVDPDAAPVASASVRRGGTLRTVLAGAAGLVVAATIGVVAWATGPAPAPVSRVTASNYGTVPTYTLTDQNGQAFQSASVLGKVQVVSYLFPYCTSFCPLLLGSLAQAESILSADGVTDQVAFVAFNVDPEHAGPSTMAAFLAQEQVDPADPAWHFLTGSSAALTRIIRDGFHVFYQRVSAADEKRIEAQQKADGTFTPQPTAPNALAGRASVDYDVVHNDVVEIVDRDGVIRTILADGSVPTPDDIVAAVRAALAGPG